MTEDYKILKGTVRSMYGSVCWSHKIQEKQAEIYANKYRHMETINIVCSAAVGVGVLSLFFADCLIIKLLSTIVSFASAFIAAYFKSFDLKELSKDNKKAALKLLGIRDELKFLLMMIKAEKSNFEILSSEYKEIIKRLDSIYLEAPNTSEKAVELARIALEVNKDNEITDEEINRNLPEELRD